MIQIDLYCDGACAGNPGPGGYAFTLIAWEPSTEAALKTLHGQGYELDTTNQRMELRAALEGLKALTKPTTLTVISDSQYLIKGMSAWITGWMANGWRNSKKKAVENQDLWIDLLAAAQPHTIAWHWTQGHAPNTNRFSYFNNIVDTEAVKQRDQAKLLLTSSAIRAEDAYTRNSATSRKLVTLAGHLVMSIDAHEKHKYIVNHETHAHVVNADYTLYLLP